MSDEIQLPDGRKYAVQDLLQQVGKRQVTNLRTGRALSGRPTKYSVQDRIWQAGATITQIQQRYRIKDAQAKGIQWKARQILTLLHIAIPDSEKDSEK
jgi:hypothetical protein